SSNAADYFASGLKGREGEEKIDEHSALGGTYDMTLVEHGTLVQQPVPLRNALNEVLRDAYIKDCQRGVVRWNKTLEKAGMGDRLVLPSRRFHRHVGLYAGHHFTPAGDLVTADEWKRRRDEWLPSTADLAYVKSVMQPVYERGKIASWVAPTR